MMASRVLLGEHQPADHTQMSPDERLTFEKIVPSAYHDFADVFAQGEADILPPHRPYDHSIDLEPNTNPPYGPIYSLSETELHALRNYLDDNLRKGFIRPSNSPAAVLPANFYINVQQMLHNYICCNIKVQQMLQFVLFNLWRFCSKCWTIYIDYKHSIAAAFIMALIACWISFFREF